MEILRLTRALRAVDILLTGLFIIRHPESPSILMLLPGPLFLTSYSHECYLFILGQKHSL